MWPMESMKGKALLIEGGVRATQKSILMIDPKMLILDEPTEGIQPNIVKQIGDIITQLNEELGLTVLLVEQKLPFARRVADTFCILDRGRSVAQGEIAELSDELVERYLTV